MRAASLIPSPMIESGLTCSGWVQNISDGISGQRVVSSSLELDVVIGAGFGLEYIDENGIGSFCVA